MARPLCSYLYWTQNTNISCVRVSDCGGGYSLRSCHRRPYPTATADKHEMLWMSAFGAARGVFTRGGGPRRKCGEHFICSCKPRVSQRCGGWPRYSWTWRRCTGHFFYRRFGGNEATLEASGTGIWRRITDERGTRFNRC